MRVVVITGGSSGLGLATGRALAAQGDHVIITAREKSRAEEAVADFPGSAEGQSLDVSSDESVESFFGWLGRTHGRIDVLFNNAAAIYEADAPESLGVGVETIAMAFNNNALSAWRMMERALPMMNEQGYGRIINVSSGMGSLTQMGPNHPAYRCSKASMNAMTRILAFEAKGDVLINSVCPGWVKTELGGVGANRSVEEGIQGMVWAANIEKGGPNGGFFRDGEAIDW